MTSFFKLIRVFKAGSLKNSVAATYTYLTIYSDSLHHAVPMTLHCADCRGKRIWSS